MYYNPSAHDWKSQYEIDSNVLGLHRKLPHYAETPLRKLSQSIGKELGVDALFFKDESIRFGLPAFKILGASWASYHTVTAQLGLSPTVDFEAIRVAVRNSNIVLHAATEGNFGRAVARMATLMGVTAKIYVPKTMVESTRQIITSEGAEVIVSTGNYDDAVREATQGAKDPGGLHIQDDGKPGYEDVPARVVEGYSTMMLEIDRQIQAATGKDPDLVVVPVGVGSLAQATVAHFKNKPDAPFLLSVEPDTAACLQVSLGQGGITTISTSDSRMCGMNCGTVSYTAWPYLKMGIDFSISVSEAEAAKALEQLHDCQIATGPCSGGTLAGLVKFMKTGRGETLLKNDSVIVVLGTEGPR